MKKLCMVLMLSVCLTGCSFRKYEMEPTDIPIDMDVTMVDDTANDEKPIYHSDGRIQEMKAGEIGDFYITDRATGLNHFFIKISKYHGRAGEVDGKCSICLGRKAEHKCAGWNCMVVGKI